MTEDWIEEGLVQIRLAAVWQGYARLLKSDAAAGDLCGQLRGLAAAFLRSEWLPGAAEVVADFFAEPEVLADGDWPERVAQGLRCLVPGGSRDEVHRQVRECGLQVRSGAIHERGDPTSTTKWQPEVAERVRFWFDQARVLVAWSEGSAERTRLMRSLALVGEAAALGGECVRLRQLIGTTGRQRWSLFGRTHSPGFLAEVDTLLKQCANWFDRFQASPPLAGQAQVLDRLEQEVSRLLQAQPASWPPARLARLQGELFSLGASPLPDLESTPDRFATWADELEKGLPGLARADQARLILARSLVEAANLRPLSEQGCDRLGEAIRDLGCTGTLELELVRGPGQVQPGDVIVFEEDASALALSPKQLGLAVRRANSPWFGFPPARVARPLPGPASEEDSWLRMPPPPEFAPIASGGAVLTAPPLIHWHALVRKPSSRPSWAERVKEARTAFTAWLETPTGLEWFHLAARSTTQPDVPEHEAALAWMNKLLAEGWCICYPHLVAPNQLPIWPVEALATSTLNCAFDPSSPGTVLRVDRFAPNPTMASCVLSQGPRSAGTALDQAARLHELAAGPTSLLAGPLSDLLRATRMQVVCGVEPKEPEGLLLPVLDALAQAAAQPASDTAATLDEILQAIRAWGQQFGLQVLPRRWRYQEALDRLHLQGDETTEVNLVFRTNKSAGQVYRIRAFGLNRNGVSVRDCQIDISAGPPPPGFPELEELVKQPRTEEEAVWQQRLRGWREAALAGTLDVIAVQLYVDFWGTPGNPWRQRDPRGALRFADRLADVLQLALGLRTFSPTRYEDHPPGWLEVISERGMVSGRVRRVLRPGLQDEMGRLRLPAIVQVE